MRQIEIPEFIESLNGLDDSKRLLLARAFDATYALPKDAGREREYLVSVIELLRDQWKTQPPAQQP